jgi:hypothetical protein
LMESLLNSKARDERLRAVETATLESAG